MHLLNFIYSVFLMSVKRQLAFRVNFVFQLLLTTLGILASILAIIPIFQRTSEIGGWSFADVIVLMGTFQFVSGLLSTFVEPNLSFFQGKVTSGEVDDLLTRPMPSLFVASFNSCNPWSLFQALIGVLVISAGVRINHDFAANLLIFVMQVFVGFLIAWAYRVMVASIAFWAPGTEPSVLFDAFWQFGRYPATVYTRSVRWVLTFVVPVASVAMFPAQTLTHGANLLCVCGSLLLGVVSITFAVLIWSLGLRRYTSATS